MFTEEISIIIFLIILNAFFAMSELAIISSRKPILRQKAKRGSKSAKIAIELSEDPGIFLSTVQVGITLVGILAGAYGGFAIAEELAVSFNKIGFIDPHGESVAFAITVSIITYFSVVIGELVPKQIALSNPERFALVAARPMKFLSIICKPIVYFLDFSGATLLKILRVSVKETKVTEDEIKAVIAEGAESGAIDRIEHKMLNRIIRLADRDLKSVMTPRTDITFIDVNDSIDEIKEKVKTSWHSRYPVTDGPNHNVLGILQAKKILDLVLSQSSADLKKYIKKVKFLPENTSCLKALEVFKTKRVYMIIVVDEYGEIEGLVTPSDLLEAMVGAIPGNYDSKEDTMIIEREDGSWLVDGGTPLEELYLTLGIEEFKNIKNVSTLSGFVTSKITHEIKESDKVDLYDYTFEIIDMDDNFIDKVLITKVKK